jgi:L-alanine-DL-glutamate epimerase-like enolase superfamily enzyme
VRIRDVKTILLTGPHTRDPFLLEARKLRSAAFIEIETDTEHSGFGETYAGYFCPEVIPSIVDFFRPILIGQSVDDIPELWRRMYHCGNFWCRVGVGASTLGGIEAALWDLKGKAEGVPVYKLLGGAKHAQLLAYASGGPSNYPEERLLEKVDFYLSLGFRAIKLGAGRIVNGEFAVDGLPEEAATFERRKIELVRTHVGKEVGVMLDAHMGNSPTLTWEVKTALAVAKALEPYSLNFFEEPLHYTDLDGYSELCRGTTTPIAGGECLTATCEWQVFAEKDCFDIGQPDASFLPGMSQFMHIAAMLEARGRLIATHAAGAAGTLMQNIHCGFAAGNTTILEVVPNFAGLHSDLLLDGGFMMKNGYVFPPERPGLGIHLTDAIKERYPFIPGTGEFNSVPGKVLTN